MKPKAQTIGTLKSIEPPHIVAIHAEDLDARRHGDDHRGGGEIGAGVDVEAHRVHVVRPDDEADEADRDHRIGHAEIAEHRLLREGRDDLADDAEARQDEDVHFRMAEEPEQMLEQDRITALVGLEEGRAEIAVGQQHGDGAAEDRQRQQQQEGGDQHRPHEQRHAVQRHARRTHVEDGGDEVDGAQDRRGAGKVHREDGHVDRHARLSFIGERRVKRPAATHAAIDQAPNRAAGQRRGSAARS